MKLKSLFKSSLYLLLAVGSLSANAGAYEDFFRAVSVDDERTVGNLVARGFDPNSPDEKGQVGLYLALRGEAPKVVQTLLANPATRVDQANPAGETPLMMAALRGRLEWAPKLIERGAQVDRQGWAPLHYAASGPEPRFVGLLLERGASVDALSPNRSTPLMMAARYGDERSVDLLLAKGADPKLRNDKGLNAADFAREGGREALAARLAKLAS
jgi:ankyrin repeat protein